MGGIKLRRAGEKASVFLKVKRLSAKPPVARKGARSGFMSRPTLGTSLTKAFGMAVSRARNATS